MLFALIIFYVAVAVGLFVGVSMIPDIIEAMHFMVYGIIHHKEIDWDEEI